MFQEWNPGMEVAYLPVNVNSWCAESKQDFMLWLKLS